MKDHWRKVLCHQYYAKTELTTEKLFSHLLLCKNKLKNSSLQASFHGRTHACFTGSPWYCTDPALPMATVCLQGWFPKQEKKVWVYMGYLGERGYILDSIVLHILYLDISVLLKANKKNDTKIQLAFHFLIYIRLSLITSFAV